MQDAFDLGQKLSDSLSWLKACPEAGQLLGGVHGRLLSDEIVAVERPDVVQCSSRAIQQLIDDKSWSILARRLCADKVLVPFAFLCCEHDTEVEFLGCIDALRTEHFDDFFEGPPGLIK